MNPTIDALFAAPAAALRLWTLMFETAQASGNVLARRGPILDQAMRDPFRSDTRELNRMGAEKVVAFSRAGQSLTVDLLKLQRLAFDQLLDGIAVAWRGTVPRQRDFDRLAARGLEIMTLATESGLGALKPVHATVTANARRLG